MSPRSNRFRTVINDYQTTSHAPEALHRLVEAYLELGVAEEAQAAAAVLGYNYPGSQWYEESYDLLTAKNLAPARARRGLLAVEGDLRYSLEARAAIRAARSEKRLRLMLIALSIRDIVLIKSLTLTLDNGLTALTGETGAGKSILLDALGLALGGRGG